MKIDLSDKVVRFLVQDYVNQICNYQSEEELNWNVHKLIHTFIVVKMAERLIRETKSKLSSKLQKQILDAALLHDLGRCHEFKNGKHLKDIDHGKIGANLIKRFFPKMKIEAQSTLYHNKCPSDKDPKYCQPILDYVRDADMLANIEYQIEHTDIFFKHIYMDANSQFLSPKIDPEIFNSSKQRRAASADKIEKHTLLTGWLLQMCWFYNLRTQAGLTYARKKKIFPRFKQIIFERIIPLTTKDKKKQKELIQKIQEIFPDKLFS